MKHFGLMSLNSVRAGVGLVALSFMTMAPHAVAKPAPDSFADISLGAVGGKTPGCAIPDANFGQSIK